MALCCTAICTGIALYISQQAVICEKKIIRAVKIATGISQSGQPHDPGWDAAKVEMLTLINGGISINPHYRKITPIVADALATWGDWKNATWIWESVLVSRPYIVAMIANVVRGHLLAKEFTVAQNYLDKAMQLRPASTSLSILQVALWSQSGKTRDAIARASVLLKDGIVEPELLRVAYDLGKNNHEPALAIAALELGIKAWPEKAVDGWLAMGDIYSQPNSKNEDKAVAAYRAALSGSPPSHRDAVLAAIPRAYRDRVQ